MLGSRTAIKTIEEYGPPKLLRETYVHLVIFLRNFSLISRKQTYAFLQILFHSLGHRFGREFHIAGESYGGRYVPLFADYIIKENEKLKAESS